MQNLEVNPFTSSSQAAQFLAIHKHCFRTSTVFRKIELALEIITKACTINGKPQSRVYTTEVKADIKTILVIAFKYITFLLHKDLEASLVNNPHGEREKELACKNAILSFSKFKNEILPLLRVCPQLSQVIKPTR